MSGYIRRKSPGKAPKERYKYRGGDVQADFKDVRSRYRVTQKTTVRGDADYADSSGSRLSAEPSWTSTLSVRRRTPKEHDQPELGLLPPGGWGASKAGNIADAHTAPLMPFGGPDVEWHQVRSLADICLLPHVIIACQFINSKKRGYESSASV